MWPSLGPIVAIVNAWSECGEDEMSRGQVDGLELDGIPDRPSVYRQSAICNTKIILITTERSGGTTSTE